LGIPPFVLFLEQIDYIMSLFIKSRQKDCKNTCQKNKIKVYSNSLN